MRASPWLLSTVPLFLACVPEAVTPDRTAGEAPPSATPLPEPPAEVTLVQLTVDPAKARLEIGSVLDLAVTGHASDGAQYDLTALAAWQSGDPTRLAVIAAGRVRALEVGSVPVRVAYEGLEIEATVDIFTPTGPEPGEPTPIALAVSPASLELEVGASAPLQVTLTFDDGSVQDVSAQASFRSSAPAVVEVAGAAATAQAPGQATLTATHLGFEASSMVTVPETECTYPAGTSSPIRVGSTMPPLAWPTARGADGSVQPLVLEDVHCGRTAQTPSVIIFVVGAGWCSACPSYIRSVDGQAADIEAAGGQIVYVEAEDNRSRPASSEYADAYITNLVGRGHGLRIGDADTEPVAQALYNAELLRVFPSAFVVRTSDMKIIVDQASSNGILPYVRIAQDPNGDWSNPNAPPFSNNCGPNDEERYEPNDTPGQAQVIAPGTFAGGICTGAPDYYRVDVAGGWRLDLTFSHRTGDLDVYVWDEANDRALEIGGQKVGSESYTDDESFTHSGPALVRVHGYNGASAPYQLTLTAN